MPIARALALAEERGFDLVEVNPKDEPPTCRLLDFGQFQYQERKSAQHQRSKRTEVKGVRISAKIGPGDLALRQRQAREFLAEGHKVKVELIMRGRENAHVDLWTRAVNDFIANLGEKVAIEQPVLKTNNRLSAIVTLRR